MKAKAVERITLVTPFGDDECTAKVLAGDWVLWEGIIPREGDTPLTVAWSKAGAPRADKITIIYERLNRREADDVQAES